LVEISAYCAESSGGNFFGVITSIRNPQSAIRNPQSAIRNPHSPIRTPQSEPYWHQRGFAERNPPPV